jgi:hypothetical protein
LPAHLLYLLTKFPGSFQFIIHEVNPSAGLTRGTLGSVGWRLIALPVGSLTGPELVKIKELIFE